MLPAVLLFVIIIGLLFWSVSSKDMKEGFAGALTQLYAKGPQDRYLIGNDAVKYYHWYPYYETVWNNPTRLTGYYYYDPLYKRFPYRYGHVYPLHRPYYYPYYNPYYIY